MKRSFVIALLSLVARSRRLRAACLPEDRADVLVHSYEGGGVTIQGPSLLVRKQFAQKFSVSANHYVDKVNSASIDVVTTASPYEEERTQNSVGLDYLHDRWTMNIGFTNSKENDYSRGHVQFRHQPGHVRRLDDGSLGYSLGNDTVGRRGDATFREETERRNYRLGVSQILTKNLLLGLSWETITDEGFLNNPYRQVRYIDPTTTARLQLRARGLSAHAHERRGIDSAALLHAVACGAIRGLSQVRRYLGHRRRYVRDRLHASDRPRLDLRGQVTAVYSQNHADFYNDLFPRSQYQNFMARDKELSTFTSQTIRLGASYDIMRGGWKFMERGTLNVILDHMMFDYEDFRDLRVTGVPAGHEPFYSFDANVLQVFLSFWF